MLLSRARCDSALERGKEFRGLNSLITVTAWAPGLRCSKLHPEHSGAWVERMSHTYGLLNINRKLHRAHRLAWTLLRGPIPEGIEVCHNCPGKDNPLCVNPDHLFLGTHKDNMHDAKNKGRIGSKLTEADIQAIRTARPLTTLDKLAAQYGLNKNTICEICTQRVRKYTR